MFGSNKNNQQMAASVQADDQPAIDGFLPAHTQTHDDPISQQPLGDPAPQSTPTMDDQASSEFIMTDAPSMDTPRDDQSYAYTDEPVQPVQVTAEPDTGTAISVNTGMNDDLLALKQQALQQLSPLVGHLDQNPEDKFRTTMMMLQSTDDQNLVRVAYEAAQSIPDEKIKAQALLDVINEINYFTQKNTQN